MDDGNASSDLIESVDNKLSAVRTRQLDISFNELADMYDSRELIISPDYQRLFRWTTGAQSRFIETLILELPIPPIFLMEVDQNVYELIDGLQRISSYLNFRGQLRNPDGELNPGLELEDCDIVDSLNGHTYDTLPVALTRKLKRNFVRAEILRKESDVRLRYYMFKRLNSGGEHLEPQEVRNCTIRLLGTEFNDAIIYLSKLDEFKYCISTVPDAQVERRYDQELILRFFSFLRQGHRYRHEVGEFMTEYMEAASAPEGASPEVWDSDRDIEVFKKTFRVLSCAADLKPNEVGNRLFGSVDTRGKIRGQFAVYHFEGFALGIQSILDTLDDTDLDQMYKLGAAIYKIKTDPNLRNFTGGGKNTAQAFQARIRYFEDQLAEELSR